MIKGGGACRTKPFSKGREPMASRSICVVLCVFLVALFAARSVVAEQPIEQLLRSAMPPAAKCERSAGGLSCEYEEKAMVPGYRIFTGHSLRMDYASPTSASAAAVIFGVTDYNAATPYLPSISKFFVGLGIPQTLFDACAEDSIRLARQKVVGYMGQSKVQSGKLILECAAQTMVLTFEQKKTITSFRISPNNSF